MWDYLLMSVIRIMIYEGGRPTPGKDDDLVISLLRTNSDIQTYFRHTGHLLPNLLSSNLRLEVDCGKLAYFDWVIGAVDLSKLVKSISENQFLVRNIKCFTPSYGAILCKTT